MLDKEKVDGVGFVKKITTLDRADKPNASLMNPPDIQRLLDLLREQQYQTIGPKRRGNAIVYAPIAAREELPIGWQDDQSGGHYRLSQTSNEAHFAYTVGPHTLKRYLYPAERTFLTVKKEGRHIAPSFDKAETPMQAVIGVRACELSALAILDRVLLDGPFVDSDYAQRRKRLFIVAVNCTRPGGTCFCASMGTGPKATVGYDLSLTEVLHERGHSFVVSSNTTAGAEVLKQLGLTSASPEQLAEADRRLDDACEKMGRTLDRERLPEILNEAFDDRHWDEIASRCLTCGNCTSVCPTCFCTNIVDTTDLTGGEAQRIRQWDSCHTVAFSYIHGGSVRAGETARYRQWLMHKLSYWTEQFGTMGCVGCGRCITWCPVGIDITEEAKTFRKRITG